MSEFLGFLITGLVSGALYSMIATGVVLAYSTSGLFNIAHGAMAFVCAYCYFELHAAFHLSTPLSGAVAILVIAPVLGLGLDSLVFRRLSGSPEHVRIVGTVGLAIALPALLLWLFTEFHKIGSYHLIVQADSIPVSVGPSPAKVWKLFKGVSINSDQVIVFAFAALTALLVWLVIRHTRIGLEMRAAVDARRLAEVRGVDLIRASRAAWLLSSVCAGIVGVAGGVVLGLDNDTYTLLLFAAAAAVVLGRLRSIPIAFVGGLALGFLQDLVAGYLNFGVLAKITGLRSSVPFLVLLGGLVVLGKNRRRTAGLAAEATDAPVELTIGDRTWLQRLPWIIALALAVAYTLFVANAFWTGLMAQGFVMAVIFLSFVVVTGLGGMVSLAQAGFVTCASLLAGWMAGTMGLPFGVAAIIGVAIALVLGVLVAIPALRLDGLALALATLALAFTLDQVLFQVPALGNNGQGWTISRSLGPLHLSSDRSFALFALFVVAVITLLIRNFERSASGRAMLAVRGSTPAALSTGISQVRAKFVTFAFSAAIAGLGGVLLASFVGNVTPSANPPLVGLLWVTIAITFGIRRVRGAIAAGIASSIIPQLLHHVTTSTYVPTILFGLGAIGLAGNPDGVLAMQGRQLQAIRNKLARRKPAVDVGVPRVPARAAQRADSQPSPAAGAALSLVGAAAGYGELEVLHRVDLSLAEGSITALLGVNGAGKSTLCGTLAGTVAMSSGSVYLAGKAVQDHSPARRVEAGLFIAPESRGIFPGLTVDENLGIWLVSAGQRDQAYAKFPMLARRRSLLAGSLSGGEQQLLTLAPAFVRKPRVLVADEPTLGLAPLLCAEIMQLCVELRNDGVTVLLVEEKARDVLAVADRVAVIELGRIVWERASRDVDEQELTAVYLGGRRQSQRTESVEEAPSGRPV